MRRVYAVLAAYFVAGLASAAMTAVSLVWRHSLALWAVFLVVCLACEWRLLLGRWWG